MDKVFTNSMGPMNNSVGNTVGVVKVKHMVMLQLVLLILEAQTNQDLSLSLINQLL